MAAGCAPSGWAVVGLIEHLPTKLESGFRFRFIPKTWKAVLASSALTCVGGCKQTVHARCCNNRLATSAAFPAKATAWPTAQASGNGRRRPVVPLEKRVQKARVNETELKWTVQATNVSKCFHARHARYSFCTLRHLTCFAARLKPLVRRRPVRKRWRELS